MNSARTLLASAVDYAGLFPPTELQMRAAVPRYADHRAGAYSWMLGRFVLPVTRLDEFERAFDERPEEARLAPWTLAVIAGGDLDADARRIAGFNIRHGDAGRRDARIEAVDVKVHSLDDIAHAADVLAEPAERYFELAIENDPSDAVAAVAEAGGRAKVRTGGVTENLFPSIPDLGRFLERCAAGKVAFKATAGLHHPVRSAHPTTAGEHSPTAMMHGFLNLFLAAALAWTRGARAEALEPILREESPGAFAFDAGGVRLDGHRLAPEEIEATRRSFALAFGSCSFDEPVEDLRALGII